MPEQALTPDQVAAALQVDVTTVHRWLKRGKLRGFKLPGGDWRIWPAALREFAPPANSPVEAAAEGAA